MRLLTLLLASAATLFAADVNYDGAKVHYESYGKGTDAVVFIHGFNPLPRVVTLALAVAPWVPARDMPRRAFEQRAERAAEGQFTGAGKNTADKAHLFRGTRYEPVKRLAKRSVPFGA